MTSYCVLHWGSSFARPACHSSPRKTLLCRGCLNFRSATASAVVPAKCPTAATKARRCCACVQAIAGAAPAPPAVEQLTLQPIKRIEGHVRLPGSKSLSNRVLLLAALAEGTTTINNLLDSQDVQYMIEALGVLGVKLEQDRPARKLVVHGCSGRFTSKGAELFLGNAGTAMRPLTAAVAVAGRGKFVLDGSARMRERPIQDLIEGLQQLDVQVKCSSTGCPPVELQAEGLRPGQVTLRGDVSSQYLTGMLMAAPLAEGSGAIDVHIQGELVSKPYVDMTIRLMERFGVQVERVDGLQHLRIPVGQRYLSPGEAFVEGDASSASYFLAGATITGGTVTVEGCGSQSLQGGWASKGAAEGHRP
ncbi:hypothetical protein WJX84_007909 [Apatococcus fuscideae]|uniref:3-phosphoshikimate 1-carboxyvinyltransferase n=1 Tax=Apatococcus fuscideae TaxID=2026836 RepID=A0AAW1SQG4_9CHLO